MDSQRSRRGNFGDAARQATILIVDDDPGEIQLLGGILSREARIVFSTTGADALARVPSVEPDLVLLDAIMPGMDGFAVCAALRRDHPSIPVIFVTGKNDAASETRALEAGAIDFIHKPISPPVVRARVRNHIDLKWKTDHLEGLVKERSAGLLAANAELARASKLKDRFLASVSHELRTPLGAVLGMTELLQQEAPGTLSEAALGHLAVIESSGRHLLSTINDMLDVARSTPAVHSEQRGEIHAPLREARTRNPW